MQDPSQTKKHISSLQKLFQAVFPEIKISEELVTTEMVLKVSEETQSILEDYGDTLGVDRALKIFYSSKHAQKEETAVGVVSLGTATTFEVVTARGTLVESMILPGVQMSFDALSQKTGLLPQIDYQSVKPETMSLGMANGTSVSIARGVLMSIFSVISTAKTRYKVGKIWICGGSSAHFINAIGGELDSLHQQNDPGTKSDLKLEVEEDLGLHALDLWMRCHGQALLSKEGEVFHPLLAQDIKPESEELAEGEHESLKQDRSSIEDPELVGEDEEASAFDELGERSRTIANSLFMGRKHFRARTTKTPVQEEFRRLGGRVETSGVGERVDRHLAMKYRFHQRDEWRERVLAGEIMVERGAPRVRNYEIPPSLEPIKHTYRLKTFDQLWMFQPAEYEPGFVKETHIIKDCGDDVVFHKPGNLVVHATGLYGRNTLLDVFEELGHKNVFPVHRIDRETSGIIVCARSSENRRVLADCFRDSVMQKMYIAVVQTKTPIPKEFVVDAPIGNADTSRIRLKMWVGNMEGAQEARTRYLTLATSGETSLVACFPETGRTNQIRVHLAACGFWILGDKMYHPDETVFMEYYENGLTESVLSRIQMPRHALHNAVIHCESRAQKIDLFKDGPVVCPLSADLTEFKVVKELMAAAGIGLSGSEQEKSLLSIFESITAKHEDVEVFDLAKLEEIWCSQPELIVLSWKLDEQNQVKTFAVFSDIHANEAALDACVADLESIERQSKLQFPRYTLGDTIDAGPKPFEVVEKVNKLTQIHILGNHEDYLNECVMGKNPKRYDSSLWSYIPWTLKKLGIENFKSFYASMLFTYKTEDSFLQLMHGSFEANDRAPAFIPWKNAPVCTLDEDLTVYEGPCKKLCVAGHTHTAGVHLHHNNEVWVNAGSVGYPFLQKKPEDRHKPFSTYLVGVYDVSKEEVSLRIRKVPYSLKRLWKHCDDAGVLDSCTPYARAIFLQTVLNESIIYRAFQKVKKRNSNEEDYARALASYLDSEGYNKEFDNIIQLAKSEI